METKIPTAPKSLGRQLNMAAGAGNGVINRILEPQCLSLAQWAVLSCLWRNGEMSVKDVAQLTGNAPPAASRIIDRMIAADLVHRRPDPDDRRAVVVGLTPRAEGLRHLQGVYEQVNAVLLAGFSPDEAEMLFGLLARVETSARDWLADQTPR